MKKYLNISAICAACVVVLGACNQTAMDNSAAGEAAIRAADSSWATVANPKTVETFAGYFLDDAVLMPPNQPTASGKEAIHKVMNGLFGMPGFSVKWQLSKVEAAKSGDIGYTYGTFEMTMNDTSGTSMTNNGRFMDVWKKQADGSWKVSYEMFNNLK